MVNIIKKRKKHNNVINTALQRKEKARGLVEIT